MQIKLKKEEVLKKFKKTEFPEISLEKEKIELLKDKLFNKISEEPLSFNKQIKLSLSFMKDESSENQNFKPRSASSFKPNSNYINKYNNKNEETQKKDNVILRAQVHQISRKFSTDSTPDYIVCRENCISIINSVLCEFIPQPKQVNLKKDLSYLVNYSLKENPNDKIVKGRKFSECSDFSVNSKSKKDSFNEDPNNLNNFDIKNIYKINESLNYSKDEPFWYINQPLIKASIGPISSVNLEKMFKDNLINLFTEIRMIDVFNINSKSNFEYLQLCHYDQKIIENLIPSNLVSKSLIGNKVYKVKINLNSGEFEDLKVIKKSNANENTPVKNEINKGSFIKKNEIQIQGNLFNRNNINNNNIKSFNIPGFTRQNFSPKKEQKLDTSYNLINKNTTETPKILKPSIPLPIKKEEEGKFIM